MFPRSVLVVLFSFTLVSTAAANGGHAAVAKRDSVSPVRRLLRGATYLKVDQPGPADRLTRGYGLLRVHVLDADTLKSRGKFEDVQSHHGVLIAKHRNEYGHVYYRLYRKESGVRVRRDFVAVSPTPDGFIGKVRDWSVPHVTAHRYHIYDRNGREMGGDFRAVRVVHTAQGAEPRYAVTDPSGAEYFVRLGTSQLEQIGGTYHELRQVGENAWAASSQAEHGAHLESRLIDPANGLPLSEPFAQIIAWKGRPVGLPKVGYVPATHDAPERETGLAKLLRHDGKVEKMIRVEPAKRAYERGPYEPDLVAAIAKATDTENYNVRLDDPLRNEQDQTREYRFDTGGRVGTATAHWTGVDWYLNILVD